jgi:aminoglycoside 3-N-acetyltransferase
VLSGPLSVEQPELANQLRALGLQPGDSVLVHSSFRSLGIADPERILGALVEVLGPEGTLLMPALSFEQQPHHHHETRITPCCVGFLPEYFRTRPGTLRSLHPTHSVCAVGAKARSMLCDHRLDTTPCGPHSPFRHNLESGGKILMIGCGLRPNTTMHAVEEYLCPPYLFGGEVEYVIINQDGRTIRKNYRVHGFDGYEQRYDRAAGLLSDEELCTGPVGGAVCYLMEAGALHRRGLEYMQQDPYFFVDPVPESG